MNCPDFFEDSKVIDPYGGDTDAEFRALMFEYKRMGDTLSAIAKKRPCVRPPK